MDGINVLIAEKDCNDNDKSCSITYYKKPKTYTQSPTIILFKEEGKYYPVYRYNNKGGLVGLFNTKSKFIKALLDNS